MRNRLINAFIEIFDYLPIQIKASHPNITETELETLTYFHSEQICAKAIKSAMIHELKYGLYRTDNPKRPSPSTKTKTTTLRCRRMIAGKFTILKHHFKKVG